MEKIKRILALTGALLLVALYALIPVLLYGYILIARLLKERGSEDDFSDK